MSDLKNTVETHPNLFEIHFDAEGNHYFNTWKATGMGEERFGKFVNGVPILTSRIVETKTREEVLGLKASFDSKDKADFVKDKVDEKTATQNGTEFKKEKRRK